MFHFLDYYHQKFFVRHFLIKVPYFALRVDFILGLPSTEVSNCGGVLHAGYASTVEAGEVTSLVGLRLSFDVSILGFLVKPVFLLNQRQVMILLLKFRARGIVIILPHCIRNLIEPRGEDIMAFSACAAVVFIVSCGLRCPVLVISVSCFVGFQRWIILGNSCVGHHGVGVV